MTEKTEIETRDSYIVEKVVLHGDLSDLSPKDRVAYYARVCNSLGLNPFTRPFEYIKLNNKLVLYARRDATDQLRSLKGVSINIPSRELTDGVYVVTARGTMGSRTDESIGAVDISNLKGDFRANAMMKAETKAKRRVTLSIVGLGWLDESEVADIGNESKEAVNVNIETGEIEESKVKDEITGDFKNPGEFYTACLKKYKLSKSKVDAEVAAFDLTKADQRKRAWQTIESLYGVKPVVEAAKEMGAQVVEPEE